MAKSKSGNNGSGGKKTPKKTTPTKRGKAKLTPDKGQITLDAFFKKKASPTESASSTSGSTAVTTPTQSLGPTQSSRNTATSPATRAFSEAKKKIEFDKAQDAASTRFSEDLLDQSPTDQDLTCATSAAAKTQTNEGVPSKSPRIVKKTTSTAFSSKTFSKMTASTDKMAEIFTDHPTQRNSNPAPHPQSEVDKKARYMFVLGTFSNGLYNLI